METKNIYKIMTNTKFGVGCITRKGTSFQDAFDKLCASDKVRATSIFDEEGETFYIHNSMILSEDEYKALNP